MFLITFATRLAVCNRTAIGDQIQNSDYILGRWHRAIYAISLKGWKRRTHIYVFIYMYMYIYTLTHIYMYVFNEKLRYIYMYRGWWRESLHRRNVTESMAAEWADHFCRKRRRLGKNACYDRWVRSLSLSLSLSQHTHTHTTCMFVLIDRSLLSCL